MEPTALSGAFSLLPAFYLTGISHLPDPGGLELHVASASSGSLALSLVSN